MYFIVQYNIYKWIRYKFLQLNDPLQYSYIQYMYPLVEKIVTLPVILKGTHTQILKNCQTYEVLKIQNVREYLIYFCTDENTFLFNSSDSVNIPHTCNKQFIYDMNFLSF
jgi:hypothetical protein